MPVASSTESSLLKNAWGTDTLSSDSLTSGIEDTSLNASNVRFQDPNCYMNFDGQNLDLYNNGLVNRLSAQSGHDDFQSSVFQGFRNIGPIPEGTYYTNQNERQSLTLKNILLKLADKLGVNSFEKSSWSGNPISWGLNRVWLKPDSNTNTYGRDGFSIHGGLTKGSKGCIDIPWQTDELSDYLDDCQFSVPVKVKYPKNW